MTENGNGQRVAIGQHDIRINLLERRVEKLEEHREEDRKMQHRIFATVLGALGATVIQLIILGITLVG